MNETKKPENRAYKVTLILLLGLAAFTTAMKELNRLHEMVSSVHGFARQWRGSDLVTRKEKPASIEVTVPSIESCPNDGTSAINSSAESGLSGLIAAATDGYVEKMDYETIAEPEVPKVDLAIGKRANRNVPQASRPRFAPARNLKEEISWISADGNWPARVEHKTLDRRVTVQLPMIVVNDIKPDAFENEVSPDFLLGLLGKIERKHSRGKAETRKREIVIKGFERSINFRRAS
ncbi:MAG: hypothetical protein ND895_02070 [Pyrinomonadaceae bacterium]|nr:hypothetical protein [Pyrinomonadaceae bacterium]